MNYHHFIITAGPEEREIALAFLSELPFDTFEETDTGLEAYVRADVYSPALQQQLDAIMQRLGLDWEQKEVPYQNWNKTWEESFEPIQVGSFCGVRATFHEPMQEVEHEIVIDPEMAFGTGHHATTYMMMEAMQALELEEKAVFDYGCGTGILAILAAKLGAVEIDAVDIEEAAYERTLANADRNQAAGIKVYFGALEAVPPRDYDVILANINRNVILTSLPALYERLTAGGILLASGILRADQSLLAERAKAQGFEAQGSAERGDWCCLRFVKPL
jgi:ribosomal protein L11 methyltransferase